MSDRVAIIGGSTPGRDHFPFPVTDGDETFFTHPLWVDLTSAAKWFYKVKKWHLYFPFDYVFWDFEGSPPAWVPKYGSATIDLDFQWKIDRTGFSDWETPTRESALVLTKASSSQQFILKGDTSIVLPESDPFENPMEITNEAGTVTDAYGRDDIALCEMYFNTGFNGSGGGNFDLQWRGGEFPFMPAFRFSFRIGNNPYYAGLSEAGASVGGGLVVDGVGLGVFYLSGFETEHTDTVSYAGPTITPIEYWPYATKPTEADPAGLPVYDTATGAQLRDPLS